MALREIPNEFYVAAFEHSTHAILGVDDQGRILVANEAAASLFRTPREALIGLRVTDFRLAEHDDESERLWRILQSGGTFREDVHILTNTGQERAVRVAGKGNIEPDLHLAILGDVTRRKEHELSSRRYELLREHGHEILLFIDCKDGRIVEANRAAELAYGYTHDELLAMSIREIRHQTADFEAQFRRAKVQSIVFETEHRRKDGTYFPVEVSSRPTKIGDDLVLLSVIRDIAERRALQAKLLEADRLSTFGMMAAGLAHEINNPLAYVASNLELLDRQLVDLEGKLDGGSTKPLQEAVAAARHGAARMRDIVRGLKTFSRIDQDGKTAVDLARVADLAIEVASHQIGQRARLVRDYAKAPRVPGNESRLSQVFMNLLVNAAQAIAPGAAADNEIRVRIFTDQAGRARVEVSDTGSGIEPEHLGRIFDPFYTTNPTGEGTGLGLSICHGIVKELGGDIEVTSTSRKGTTFALSLPAVDASEAELRPASEPKQRAVTTRKRICVVDDEARYAESLRMLLGYDHDVALAPSAERALELLSGGQAFDVIVCDLMMPGKTGMDLHDELTGPSRERMIFLTGGATTERAREFLARPDIRYLEKPVELPILEAMIEEVTTLASAGRMGA